MGLLTELGYPTEDISFPGGKTLPLRGLALDDILKLARLHGPALAELYNRIMADPDGFSLSDTKSVVMDLMDSAPAVVADIIALAADEPSAAPMARKMVFSKQLECMTAIGRLTFQTEEDVKKALEAIIQMAKGMSQTVAVARTSEAGSLASASR